MASKAKAYHTQTERRAKDSSTVLKCDRNIDPEYQSRISWSYPKVSSGISRRLMDILVPDRELERGMFCTKSNHRIQKLHSLCNAEGVNVRGALSYRRYLMRQWNPKLSLSQLELGTEEHARQAALLYVSAVRGFLLRRYNRVDFYTKDDQHAHIRQQLQPGQPYPPTPDFVLMEPIRIYRSKQKWHYEELDISLGWIDVKSFYGVYTEECSKSAVGRVMLTARKYVQLHGPGAMVFMHGCDDRLAKELWNEQVLVLDASTMEGIDLSHVDAYMRTYCGDARGHVLP